MKGFFKISNHKKIVGIYVFIHRLQADLDSHTNLRNGINTPWSHGLDLRKE